MKVKRRVVLGEGYLCFDINGLSLRLLGPGRKPDYWPPSTKKLKNLGKNETDYRHVRLVAEILESARPEVEP